jgi:hypothetical protein
VELGPGGGELQAHMCRRMGAACGKEGAIYIWLCTVPPRSSSSTLAVVIGSFTNRYTLFPETQHTQLDWDVLIPLLPPPPPT